MTDTRNMWDDFLKELRTEELKASFQRVKIEYMNQVGWIRSGGHLLAGGGKSLSEAERLWGPDRSQWRVHELAVERAVDKERRYGTSEDVLVDVQRVLEMWREKAAEKVKERRH